jgi:hypothetical protein
MTERPRSNLLDDCPNPGCKLDLVDRIDKRPTTKVLVGLISLYAAVVAAMLMFASHGLSQSVDRLSDSVRLNFTENVSQGSRIRDLELINKEREGDIKLIAQRLQSIENMLIKAAKIRLEDSGK